MPKLTKLELRIMEALWSRGACSIREIQEVFPERERPAYTTIQTTVYRLEDKKALRRAKKISNAHIFEAVVSRNAAQSRLIDDLLGLFGGRTQPVMSHLIESGKLTLDDIHEAEKSIRNWRERKSGKMISMLANHFWQSTVFAAAAGLLTLVLRRNHARDTRYLAGGVAEVSDSFFPAGFGRKLPAMVTLGMPPPRLSIAMDEISRPFKSTPVPRAWTPRRPLLPPVLLTSGSADSRPAHFHLRLAPSSIGSNPSIADRSQPAYKDADQDALLGCMRGTGHLRSVPAGTGFARGDRRPSDEGPTRAIVAHELCHVGRRDNLAAAVHMIVEAVFWFHPLVWWIGTRLVEERERACDEEVLPMAAILRCTPKEFLTFVSSISNRRSPASPA